ncbi:hypothetical protein MJ923_19885 [Shewanella sp. 3B26]|uniref:Uncharacterized protein n=1 Tax=Shewanella zhuhaiensis TaxID=2919576 RepID=A0AAJ1F1S4_9GAMM|nr:hypothetical protein [Shewanella zhuhaiensis]MCH4296571.1 hypothetical protein [Shewanella zhuhaiensis]
MLLAILTGILSGYWLARHSALQRPFARVLLLASFPLYHLVFALFALFAQFVTSAAGGFDEALALQQGAWTMVGHELVATLVFGALAFWSQRQAPVLPAALLGHGVYDLLLASDAAPWWWGAF